MHNVDHLYYMGAKNGVLGRREARGKHKCAESAFFRQNAHFASLLTVVLCLMWYRAEKTRFQTETQHPSVIRVKTTPTCVNLLCVGHIPDPHQYTIEINEISARGTSQKRLSFLIVWTKTYGVKFVLLKNEPA